MILPKQYKWLADEEGPRILREGLKTYGTAEQVGPGSNPSILSWAKETGLRNTYTNDGIAWCGLWMAYVALQAGFDPLPVNPLGARNWRTWGVPKDIAKLGDVLVFWRGSQNGYMGHVGMYVGEDDSAYHVLGGNQNNKVTIKRVLKSRLLEARRCKWKINEPSQVRVVKLSAIGSISTNEA